MVTARLTPRESRAVRAFVDAARALLGEDLREVRLFGSRARGDSHEDSDLDVALIVEPRGRARRHELYDLAFDIGVAHAVPLAPLVIDVNRLQTLRQRERRFALDLDAEGIVL